MARHTGAKLISEHPANAAEQYPQGAALEAAEMIVDDSFSGASIWFLFLSLSPEPNCRDCCSYLSSLLQQEGALKS